MKKRDEEWQGKEEKKNRRIFIKKKRKERERERERNCTVGCKKSFSDKSQLYLHSEVTARIFVI